MILKSDNVDLQLDPLTHDLVIKEGKIQYVSGPMAIAQILKIKILSIKTDWILDEDDGLPWFEKPEKVTSPILGSRFSQPKMQSLLRPLLLNTNGVKEILNLSVSFDSKNRNLTISWVISTSFGTLTDSLEVTS